MILAKQKDIKRTIVFLIIFFLFLCIYQANANENSQEKIFSLMNKIGQLIRFKQYKEAIPHFEELMEVSRKTMGEYNPNYADLVINAAMVYQNAGDYEKAEDLYKKGIRIATIFLGEDHAYVISALNNLGKLYENGLIQFEDAEQTYKKVYEIRKKSLGEIHPNTATSLQRLATLYGRTGKLKEAEELTIKAIDIIEKSLGKEHYLLVTPYNELANIYQSMARYAKAEELYKRALKMYEKNSQFFDSKRLDGFNIGSILHNLAVLYADTDRVDEAESLYKNAIQKKKEALGENHPAITVSMKGLATIYYKKGMISEAERLIRKIIDIQKEQFGENHINTLSTMNTLGFYLMKKGEYEEAERIFQRFYDYLKNKFGENSTHVANQAIYLSLIFSKLDRNKEAYAMIKQSVNTSILRKEYIFSFLSEREKMNYIKKIKGQPSLYIWHTQKHFGNDDSMVTDAFNYWLKWKGSVLESQSRYTNAIYFSKDPVINEKFEKLKNVKRRLARLYISDAYVSAEDYIKQIKKLEEEKEALEVELSKLSKDFALEKMAGKADAKKISEILPEGSVYMDFIRIDIYDFTQQQFGKPRYLLFLLIPDKQPLVKLIDIANSEDVDKHIKAYLHEMNAVKIGNLPDAEILNAKAKAIYELVLKPAESYFKNKRHLFISPDANLNLIPFEVLINSEGKYLTEDYLISYIEAGRDIVRFTDTAKSKGSALIMADPDYDMGMDEKEKIVKEMDITETRVRGAVSKDMLKMRFSRLPDTKQEADAIEKIIKDRLKISVDNYQNKKALEEVLFKVEYPKILHIATHGYFVSDEEVKGKDLRGVEIKFKSDFAEDNYLTIENPMLRSGIVFAGVNTSLKEGRDDGIISAEKILGLKLKGTELVVLSACETGSGDVQNGEGVFGLKRSFILSGAKTVITSLWSVPSVETTELMTDFYTIMSEGKTKAMALRLAKLEMMKKKSNPFYWGAFIISGNPN